MAKALSSNFNPDRYRGKEQRNRSSGHDKNACIRNIIQSAVFNDAMQDMVTAILQGDTYILDNLGAKFYADNGLIRDTLICLVRAMARECGALREEVRAVPPAEGHNAAND